VEKYTDKYVDKTEKRLLKARNRPKTTQCARAVTPKPMVDNERLCTSDNHTVIR